MDFFLPTLVFLVTFLSVSVLAYILHQSSLRRASAETQTQLKVLEARIKSREEEGADLRRRLTEAEKKAQEGQYYMAQAQEREKLLKQQTADLGALQSRLGEMEARARTAQELLAKERDLVAQTQQKMLADFQVLTHKLLEETGRKYADQNQEKLTQILAPLTKDLGDFRKKVEETHQEETKQLAGLQSTVLLLRDMNQKIGEEARQLTRALKGENKTQGIWGEMILEKVLETSGLRKGQEYETQQGFTAEDQKKYLPDAVIRLPGGKDVVVDAKVSLVAYDQWAKAETEDERILARKALVQSLQSHVAGLGAKNYQLLPGLRTLDYVLLFIPLEGAFPVALAGWPGLLEECFAKNIIPVTPTTLLATLRTIENSWRFERQNQNVQDIFKAAGALYDKIAAFTEDMEKIGRQMETLRGTYQEAVGKLTTGNGNALRRAQKLRDLGAKSTRQISSTWSGSDILEGEGEDV